MRILALIPDDIEHTLRCVLHPSDTMRRVFSAGALAEAARAERADAVVFDPTMLGSVDWALARTLLEDSSIPVLLYAPLTTESAPRLVAASAVGVHELMLHGVDDDAATVRRRLDTLRHPEPPAAVLSMLAPRLARLPALLQSVCVPLFCATPIPRWVDEFALTAAMPRRSIDRWMVRAGLGATGTLLDVARLARVWAPIVDRRESAADVAGRFGYGRIRILADHSGRIARVTPTGLGTKLSRNAFVARLAAHAMRD